MISVLTGTSHRPLHVRRMPRPDTSDLAEPLVRLPRQFLRAPSTRHALESLPLRHRNRINHLVLLENRADLNRLFEQPFPEIHFIRDAAAVDLDFHQVGFLLLERGLADLGVGEDADDGAVFLDALELAVDGLAGLFGVLFGGFGEGLLFGFVPVFVEAAFYFVAEMFGPDGGEGAEAAGGFDVADEADDHHLCLC